MKDRLQRILTTELTRREFLISLFFLIIGLMGLPGLLKRFDQAFQKQPRAGGYGSIPYGGK